VRKRAALLHVDQEHSNEKLQTGHKSRVRTCLNIRAVTSRWVAHIFNSYVGGERRHVLSSNLHDGLHPLQVVSCSDVLQERHVCLQRSLHRTVSRATPRHLGPCTSSTITTVSVPSTVHNIILDMHRFGRNGSVFFVSASIDIFVCSSCECWPEQSVSARASVRASVWSGPQDPLSQGNVSNAHGVHDASHRSYY